MTRPPASVASIVEVVAHQPSTGNDDRRKWSIADNGVERRKPSGSTDITLTSARGLGRLSDLNESALSTLVIVAANPIPAARIKTTEIEKPRADNTPRTASRRS